MVEKIMGRVFLAGLIMVTFFASSVMATSVATLTKRINEQKKIVESCKDRRERAFDRYEVANDKYRRAIKKKVKKSTIAKLKKSRDALRKDYKKADQRLDSAKQELSELNRARTIKTETVSDLKKKIAKQKKLVKKYWDLRSKAWKSFERARDKHRYAIKKKAKKSTIKKYDKIRSQKWKAFVQADKKYSRTEDQLDDFSHRLKNKQAAQKKKSNQKPTTPTTKPNTNGAQGKIVVQAISSTIDGF